MLRRVYAARCKHNYRIWGDAVAYDSASIEPRTPPTDSVTSHTHTYSPGLAGAFDYRSGLMRDTTASPLTQSEITGTLVPLIGTRIDTTGALGAANTQLIGVNP